MIGKTKTSKFNDLLFFGPRKTPYLWIITYQITFNNLENMDTFLKNMIFAKLKFVKIKTFEISEQTLKRRAPNNDEDPSQIILKLLNMGSLSSRKHEMII